MDSRTDVYSLGVVLYEILAGRVPFEGDSTTAVLFKHINEPPPPISGLPTALHSVVDRALSKNPDDRYQTCRALAAAFLDAIGLSAQAETVREGVLISERKRAETKAAATEGSVGAVSKGPARKRWLRTAAIGLVLCVVCSLGLSVLSQASTPTLTPSPELTEPPTDAPTDAPIAFPPVTDGVAVGTLTFQDLNSAADQVTLSAVLVPPPAGTQYEAWLIGDGRELRRSIGVLTLDDLGQTQLVFADPEARMLFYRFNSMEITLEPNPDDNPNPSGQIIYSSALPPEALGQIHGMLVSSPGTPNSISLALGLNYSGYLIMQSGDAMLAAYEAGDEAGLRANAEAIVNL
ncbi:MAG: anti-sigma factor domain-containing protein, partial [Gammaproteobacteria bacterium]